MRTDLLDPKNDYVFKRLLADSPLLLTSLINAVRHDQPAVHVVRVLNPAVLPAELEAKAIVLDVLVEDRLGRHFNVEMQASKHPEWRQRGVFYLARTLSRQLSAGEPYTELRAAVGIHLLDFDLFSPPDQAIWRFQLRDQWQPHQAYGDELELNVVEMRKVLALGEQPGPVAAWVEFFERWNEEAAMERIDDDGLREAMREARRRLEVISGDEEERIRAELREKAIRDEISWRAWALRTGRAEGHAEGHAEGRAEGIAAGLEEGREEGRHEGLRKGLLEGERAILRRQLTRRFGALPAEVDMRLRAADAASLERWSERILDAGSLEAVFSEI